VRRLRFGIAGLDPKDLKGSVERIVGAGYAACEVQFVKEFTLDERQSTLLGEFARDTGLALSVHAPYFAQLTTAEPERVRNHLGALHHSCHLASLMGATIVVVHPGALGDAAPEVLHERIDRALDNLGPRVEEFGVPLGLETTGRKTQFGTLGDIALVVRRHPFTRPVIDFAHIHALSGGLLKDAAAFEALFAFIATEFSAGHMRPLHCHFTDNRFGPNGELSHVPYGEGSLRVGNVVEGARRFDISLRLISEEHWEDSHRRILEELKASGAPLVWDARATELVGSWAREPLPVEPRGEAAVLRAGAREVRVTNLGKVLFPDAGDDRGGGYTKRDLISYYYAVAPLMLPFLRDRPIVMQRVPDGILGEAFYEKQAPRGLPEWVRTVPVPSDEGRRTTDYVVADDVATLVWLAQIASVECHAWTSRWPNLDEPDFAVLDLDPFEPTTFEDVRAVARLVKVVLDGLGIRAFPKTSGGAGIQIFVPLAGGHTYPEVRAFCAGVARLIRAAYPEKVTTELSIPRRKGHVFVDVNQNARSKTLVAPYSVRPYPGAPVSTPLRWEELDEEFFPEQFTIRTVPDRVDEVGDPFGSALIHRQDIRPAIARLEG
jgi:bifunctional non-homologous end joining protein LigD